MEILLQPQYFDSNEKNFLTNNGLDCTIFQYDSGIKAIKLKNEYGYVIVLPFNGQMIWDIVFNGRSLKMKSPFEEPRMVEEFIDSYGCFLMHCGALRMGCPGEHDSHPLHGELPYARYDNVRVLAGSDAKGDYIGITGDYTYNRAFGNHYIASPLVKMYRQSTLVDVSISVENLSNYPMDLMYMCHINFKPADDGKIVQAASWAPDNMRIRKNIPTHYQVDPDFKAFLEQLEANPQRTQIIKKEDAYYPEVIFYIDSVKADDKGWTHLMQIHPDNTADYLGYRPAELDHCVRWISKTLDQEGVGLALPATCEPEGYHAESEKGNIKTIAAKGLFTANLQVGYLDSDSAAKKNAEIEQLMHTEQ